MKTETIRIEDLRPYEKNARKHEAADVAAIAKSIEAFGFRDPVGVWGPNNIIVEGHGRVLAAKQLGMTEVPCIRLDDLTDEQRRAYALAHNKTAELSSWDMKILPAELSDIHGLDMSSFGFIPPAETGTEDDYEEPEEKKDPVVQRGQLWLLGEHRLLCGDATDPEDMRTLMSGDEADLLVTDPPYNVALGWHMRPSEAKQLHRRTDGLVIENDSMSDARFRSFLTAAFRNMAGVMKPGAAFYVWHAHTESVNFFSAAAEAGLQVRQLLVWVKSVFALGRQDYQWQHEPCMYGWKDGAAHYFVDDRTQTTVFEDARPDIKHMKKDEMRALLEDIYSDRASTTVIHEDKPAASAEHPTMKPVRLIARLLRNSSKTGGDCIGSFRRIWDDADRVPAAKETLPHDGVGSALLRCDYRQMAENDRRGGRANQ